MATGHGVGTPCNGGLLINTSRMRNVSVDPASRTANRCGWRAVERCNSGGS